jgi:hypothetical protein
MFFQFDQTQTHQVADGFFEGFFAHLHALLNEFGIAVVIERQSASTLLKGIEDSIVGFDNSAEAFGF